MDRKARPLRASTSPSARGPPAPGQEPTLWAPDVMGTDAAVTGLPALLVPQDSSTVSACLRQGRWAWRGPGPAVSRVS